MRVQFVRANAPYVAGDVAGFAPETCERFIQAGVAVAVEPGSAGTVAPAAPPVDRAVKAPKVAKGK